MIAVTKTTRILGMYFSRTNTRFVFCLPAVFLVLACLLLFGHSIPAATVSEIPHTIRHWGSEDGLPLGPGSAILQTRDGYLWFGTEEGLGRFNGTNCRIFDSFNTPEMKNHSVHHLYEDATGTLWICTKSDGILRMRDEKFRQFGRESGLSNMVAAVVEDSLGTIWVNTENNGLFQMENDRFHPYAIEGAPATSSLNELACTPDGTVWVTAAEGLYRIRGEETELFGSEELRAEAPLVMHVDGQGELWLGGQGYLARVVDGIPVRQPFEERWKGIHVIASALDGSLWLSTMNGIYRKGLEGSTRFSMDEGLSGHVYLNMIVDRENSVWVSTGSGGFDQIKPSRFRVINEEQGLNSSATTSFMEASDGAIWIGTESGLSRWNGENTTNYDTDDGLSVNLVFNIAEDQDGTIWAGTWKGLNRFEDGKFVNHPVLDGKLDRAFWCSYQDTDGTLWFGTPNGLLEYRDGEHKVWHHDNSGLSHADVRCVLRDSRGPLWVGTSWGLNQLVGDRFVNHIEAKKDEPFGIVLTLHESPDGDIWIGTMENGLFRHRNGKFTRFTTAEGMQSNGVFKILEDANGHLWMTSNRGLFRVSRNELNAVASGQSKRVAGRVFGKRDGLPTAEFNGTIQQCGLKTSNGQLWFASLAGAVVVDPEMMFVNTVPPSIGIDSIKLDGQPAPIQSNTVVVPPGTERVRLDYSVLSYVSPDALVSRCRLDGFDSSWTTNSVRHEAQYTGLKPGEYEFQVFATNEDGVESKEMKSIAIIVQPFYWQTGWFRFSAAFLLIATCGWTVRFWTMRSHRLALEAMERKHALERERTRISGDLHDDVGSNLGSIALLSRAVKRRVSDEVAEDVGEISRLAQETSDAMRDIVWFINPNEDTVEKMSLRMKDSAAVLLGGGKFVFETSNLSADTRLSPQFKRHFFLIFKECLHNVSKHANATKVVIRLSVNAGQLNLEVQDDGCGLSEPENNRGNGLASMRRRATDQQWKLEIGNRPEGGTIVRLEAQLE